MSKIEVVRRKNESFEAILRRFNDRVRKSGKPLEARKHRYHEDEPGENRVHKSAMRRLRLKEKFAYLLKIGQAIDPRASRKPRGR